MKCDCFVESNLNGSWQPVLLSFELDKTTWTWEKKMCKLQNIKKICTLDTTPFWFDDDEKLECNFVGETIAVTLLIIKTEVPTHQ